MKSIVILLGVLTAFVVSTYLCDTTGSHYYNNRITTGKVTPKVYDVSHKYLPDLSHSYNTYRLNDIYLFFVVITPFIIRWSVTPVMDFLSYYIVIVLIRCVMTNLTILPSNKHCEYNEKSIYSGCYDKIFSGHFATLFLATLIFYKYRIITNIPLLILMNIINTVVILSVRSHYTIDIVVSLIVVLLVYTNKIKINL